MLSSCSRHSREVRHYREIAVAAPESPGRGVGGPGGEAMPPMMGGGMPPGDTGGAPVAASGLKLSWTTPEGWEEQPGSGMRMATFLVGPDRKECTIVSFPGDAGGLEANLKRWLGQLHASVADDVVREFAGRPESFETEGGLDCELFDFSSILPADSSTSILAGILPVERQTVFVKLMGPPALLAVEKDPFTALCRSLKP